ncbi:MAG: glycyl-radical enzyme activating protein [Deltaproteobacteria bacterium]|nr:glycyl-radical enzyme activating protein [Deltaproteobacteria bacterium]
MPKDLEKKQPLLVEIKGNSLDDGPGIRSVVFFKGCPLACDWCHNAETKRVGPELSFDATSCVKSGDCALACRDGAIDLRRRGLVDRARCTSCFLCVPACGAGAFEVVGRTWSVAEIVQALMRYRPFYRTSGGGVTLSGGEPTLFMEFCSELLVELRARDIHVLLETCGDFSLERYLALIDPHVDQVYFDLKIMDPEAHRRFCGRDNRRVLTNFEALYRRYLDGGTPVLPRVPLVPERTATAENLASLASFLRETGVKRVALLPYNPLWPDKARKVGHEVRYERKAWMSKEEVASATRFFEGFEIGG